MPEVSCEVRAGPQSGIAAKVKSYWRLKTFKWIQTDSLVMDSLNLSSQVDSPVILFEKEAPGFHPGK